MDWILGNYCKTVLTYKQKVSAVMKFIGLQTSKHLHVNSAVFSGHHRLQICLVVGFFLRARTSAVLLVAGFTTSPVLSRLLINAR